MQLAGLPHHGRRLRCYSRATIASGRPTSASPTTTRMPETILSNSLSMSYMALAHALEALKNPLPREMVAATQRGHAIYGTAIIRVVPAVSTTKANARCARYRAVKGLCAVIIVSSP